MAIERKWKLPHHQLYFVGQVFIVLLSLDSSLAQATQWFQGFEGDPQTVGRGGTSIALPDTFFGALQNSAGSSFIVPRFLFQESRDNIQDLWQPAASQKLTVKSGGFVVPIYSWGLAAGFVNYDYGSAQIINEYTVTVSHRFLEDHFSLGAGLVYGTDGYEPSFGGTVGALYRLPQRMFLGATLQSAMNYPSVSLVHPWSSGIGFGQMPNRVFRYEAGIRMIGFNPQPYAGTEYKFIDLRQLKTFAFGGSYFDGKRAHFTCGLEINPWIFSLEGALDIARGYQNYLIGFSIDLGRTLKVLRIIPSSVSAPTEGLFPNPFEIREDWFPAHLQDDPENSFHEIPPTPRQVIYRLTHPGVLFQNESKILDAEKENFREDFQDFKELGN